MRGSFLFGLIFALPRCAAKGAVIGLMFVFVAVEAAIGAERVVMQEVAVAIEATFGIALVES